MLNVSAVERTDLHGSAVQIQRIGGVRVAKRGDGLHVYSAEIDVEICRDSLRLVAVEGYVLRRVRTGRISERLEIVAVGDQIIGRVVPGEQRNERTQVKTGRQWNCVWIVANESRGHAGVAFIGAIGRDHQRQRQRGRRPAQHYSPAVIMLDLSRIDAGDRVAEVGAVVLITHGHADRQLIAEDRHVEHQLTASLAVVADSGLDASLEFARRLIARNLKGTSRRIAAEERALRTAQHLDALDIQKTQIADDGAGVIDAVYVNAHGAVRG